MVKIHSAQTAIEIHNLKNVLEANGIRCETRNEGLRGASGEIPVNECWVELWVDDDQAEAARRVLEEAEQPSGEPWVCPQCGETVDGQFGVCWKCSKPDATLD